MGFLGTPQRSDYISSARQPSRPYAEERRTDDHRRRGESENEGGWAPFEQRLEPEGAFGELVNENGRTDPRDSQSEHSPEEPKNKTFCQKLANNPPLTGANGESDAKLTLASSRPREKKRAHICARDQEKDRHA